MRVVLRASTLPPRPFQTARPCVLTLLVPPSPWCRCFLLCAELQELLPGILNQLGPDNLQNLRKIAEEYAKADSVRA